MCAQCTHSAMGLTNKLAIASVSLGQHPSHTLDRKIAAAAQHGFSGIEIVWSDLEAYCKVMSLSLKDGASSIKDLCMSNDICILSLNPFKNFEGHTSPLSARLGTAAQWLDIARILGAQYLQVPSQFDEGNSTSDMKTIVSDLKALADLAAEGDVKVDIAYEAVAWGSYVSTWQQSRDIVQLVNKGNFGLCVDAFHVISRLWGDNTVSGGKAEGGMDRLKSSLEELRADCPLDKLFYIQLSDGELFEPPLGPNHEFFNAELDPRIIWSRNARPFPLETELKAYFPVVDFARSCLVDMGFQGWVSFEIFDWRMRQATSDPMVAAQRGKDSWSRITDLL
jgi:sugar phosphate isomerase/epimerase